MTAAGEELIADAIDNAEEVADTRDADNKPRLLVEHTDPDRTVAAMRDILKSEGDLYDRGIPVRLTKDKIRGGTVAQFMTPELLVVATHSVCRPYIMKEQRDGTIQETKTRLPRYLAVTYLDWRGDWNLPVLNGIASAPLLSDDGVIHSAKGYDVRTGMYCENVPDLVRQANWQKVGGASPPERRSNQTTFLREPCVGSREGAGEASAAVRMGGAIEHRKSDGPGCRGFQIGRRQHRRHRFGEMSANPAVSENPCTFARLLLGPWEVFKLPRLS